jgi:hypothetical protein
MGGQNIKGLLILFCFHVWSNLGKYLYLWRKVVCFLLFCFVVMRSTKLGCFRSCSLYLWKALNEEECMGLVPWRLDLQCKSSWILNEEPYWMISSVKIKLNYSWKFRRDWNVHLVLLERSWWAGFNGIYLVWFGFTMREILIFQWFLLLENSNKFQKTDFGRKNQLRTS